MKKTALCHIIIIFLKPIDKEKILKKPEKSTLQRGVQKHSMWRSKDKHDRFLMVSNANQWTVEQCLQSPERKTFQT